MATVDTNDLWFAYAKQIQQQAAPTFDPAKQQFSLASTTLSLDLGNADPAIVSDYIYNLGNTIPSSSPGYAPGSALLTSYQLFLDAIDLKGNNNPNLDSQINIASGAMTGAQNNFITVQASAVSAWTTYKAINPNISFSDYTTQQYPTYIQAKNALDAATSKWQQLMVQKYGQGYGVVAAARNKLSATGGASDITMANAFNMPVKTGVVAAAGGVPMLPGQAPQGPANTLFSTFAPSFNLNGFTTVYQQWQAASASGAAPAVSLHVDNSASAATWSDFGWNAQAQVDISVGFFDLFVKTAVSGTNQSAFAFTDGFDMTIDFTGLSSFEITPGPWFDLGIVSTFRNQLLPNSPPFFAPNGSLARLPYQAVVGFEPKITLMASQSDYASFKSTFQSNTTTAFGFGPFVVGEASVSTYSDKAGVAYSDANASITISPPPSTVPVLLGVVSSRLDV